MHRVLIIDLSEHDRQLLTSCLEPDNYQVLEAEGGYQAFEMFETSRPHLVIADVLKPDTDGIEMMRQLKELDPDAEIILLVDYDQMELGIQALELEASDIIVKPASAAAIRVTLQRAERRIWKRTRLQEAIEEIKKRHDFEHRLILTSMDGIIANDRKGNIIIFNEGASLIYGYSRDEALSRVHVTALYPEGEARRIKKMIYSSEYGAPGRLINCEVQAVTKDGREVPILLSATLIYEGDQEVATVGYFKDLTELKRLQQELVHTTRTIATDQAVSDMAQGMNNFLYGMKLGASMVEKGIDKKDMEDIVKGWHLVSKNIDHISHLTLDMQSFARKEPLYQELISVNELVSRVLESAGAKAAQRGIELTRELDPEVPPTLINAQKLQACILHLMNNALEAFAPDAAGGSITVRTGVHPKDGAIFVEVSDTGKGISQDLQKKIFNPFFTTKRAEGTGMGLAIAQRIIREYGGSIQVRSQTNRGSTFTVYLPPQTGEE